MATQAHCAFCFETLSAHFDGSDPLSLEQVEGLWEQYQLSCQEEGDENDQEQSHAAPAKPAAVSRLAKTSESAGSSSSSLPSVGSAGSKSASEVSSSATTPGSSTISLPSIFGRAKQNKHPLFVTWNLHSSRSGSKSLRGCIGTFEAQELEYGLSSYALTSALEDHRFSPVPASQLPQLSNHVTLLTNFAQPVSDPLDWELGVHGIRISFTYHGRRYGATYLPDVAKEQGWTKDETLISLMKKAGWNGSSSGWQKVWREGRGELVRYEGKQVGLEYAEWRKFRDWVDDQERDLRFVM